MNAAMDLPRPSPGPEEDPEAAERIRRLKKLYALSMTLSGDPLDVFKGVAEMIGELFDVSTVCLSEICGDELRFLSVYENGIVTLNAGCYPLRTTPCATVIESKDIRTYDAVAERFPEAPFLKERNAYSYCGFPSLGPDGRVVAVTCLLDPEPREFTDEDREVLQIFGQRIAMEIERRRLLDERRHIDSELWKISHAVEQSPCAIMITDTKGVIEYVSPKFFEITGYSAHEVIGRTPAILKSGMTPAAQYKELWDCLASGRKWRGAFLNRKKNGELYWSRESISPIRNALGEMTHFLAIEEDTTESQRIEDKLREVQKMEAVGQLAGGIAHDFNNLLTVILGNLELIFERAEGDTRLSELTDMTLKSALRAADLTRQLLATSRKQPLRPEVIDAGSLVAGLVDMLQATLGETIAIRTVMPSGLWQAYADPGQVEAALLNLAMNARDAMPHGGTLTIELANVRLDGEEAAKHGDAQTGDYLMFTVTDTGIGMPPEVASRAFEPFYTTKDLGKGTGLGLSTVHGFARQSGGFAELESEPGKGTSIRIYLPRTMTRDEAAADLYPSGATPSGDAITPRLSA